MPIADYLDWVTVEAASAPVTYFPHRRESAAQVAAVEGIPGVHISKPALPAELVLAGATERLEIITLPSSTTTTIPLVLSGTGSVIRSEGPAVHTDGRSVAI